jgi:hypothetical protein
LTFKKKKTAHPGQAEPSVRCSQLLAQAGLSARRKPGALNGGIVAMSGLDGGSRGDVESSKSRDCTDPSTGFDFFSKHKKLFK